MERLLIFLAVLICVVAGVAVVAMSARGRREPLRMGAELDAEDEHLVIGTVAAPASPIDREAEILDPRLIELEWAELNLIAAKAPTSDPRPLPEPARRIEQRPGLPPEGGR